MTALIAPVRATSFEGLVFFVYDRDAVKKEADPPENAIVYFYPPSASIEDRVSVCGQLVGMSQFMHGFLQARPALCKLQSEKVATVHSGKYTLALGGSLNEPDSLLITQLQTLHSTFTFYHGSLERIRMMCESQKMFLTWMSMIWDCYLHFVRHYGDFLPGVFDPLPFLDLPKRVAATCFTKASYFLQACQRRKHVLGGCILYRNKILCSQLEPSITERLLLLKPYQSHHPSRPVKTECSLPFGVRILNAFLTLSEYLNLYDALAQSAYRQPPSRQSSKTFPDVYTTVSSATVRDSSYRRKSNANDSQHFNDSLTRLSSDLRAKSNGGLDFGSPGRERNSTTKDLASGTPLKTTKSPNGDSRVADHEDSTHQLLKNESSETLMVQTNLVVESDETAPANEQGRGTIVATVEERCKTANESERNNENVTSTSAEKRAEKDGADSGGGRAGIEFGATSSVSVFDSSSFESSLSTDTSVVMETVDVVGLNIIENLNLQCETQQYGEEKRTEMPCNASSGSGKVVDCSSLPCERQQHEEETDQRLLCSSSSSCERSSYCSIKSFSSHEVEMCKLILDDLITQAVDIAHQKNSQMKNKGDKNVTNRVACCQACFALQKSSDMSCGNSFCQSGRKCGEDKSSKTLTNENSCSGEQTLGKLSVANPPVILETNLPLSDHSVCNEGKDSRLSYAADVAEKSDPSDLSLNKGNSLRSDLIKTPIVCDSFPIRNLNMGPEKFLDKSLACLNTSIAKDTRDSLASVENNASQHANSVDKGVASDGLALVSEGIHSVPPIDIVEHDSGIFVTNGLEGTYVTDDTDLPPIDLALEEMEDDESPEWFEPPLGDAPSSTSREREELLLYEEGGDDMNQVEGLTHVNLYVQAHSKVVLILLVEEGLNNDCNSIKALWETSLNQLGELEFLVKQSLGDESVPVQSDEYSFLLYDSFERNMKGNLDELVYQVDHSFCETTKLLHEQFENCPTLKDVTLRNRLSTIYGKRNLGRGAYFHLKGSNRTGHTIPFPRDPICQVERRASKILHKEHGVNVF